MNTLRDKEERARTKRISSEDERPIHSNVLMSSSVSWIFAPCRVHSSSTLRICSRSDRSESLPDDAYFSSSLIEVNRSATSRKTKFPKVRCWEIFMF